MGAMRPTGRFQVACEVEPGVHEKMLATVADEGISMSSLLRRAILRELRCDANGNAIDSEARVSPLAYRCVRCKRMCNFDELEDTGGICAVCIVDADA